jgi:hypothetical protein
MRVEEPMLSMVATRRRPDRRSGAIRPIARQAPLNSSISAISDRISGVMRRVAMLSAIPLLHPFAPDFYRSDIAVCPSILTQLAWIDCKGAAAKPRGREADHTLRSSL